MKKIITASLIVATATFANSYAEKADKVSKTLIKTLGGKLKKELKTNGPVAALKYCSTNAYTLTQQVSDKYKKMSVKRISLKPRNPANTPSKDEAVILQAMQDMQKVGVRPKKVIQEKDGKIYVYKPLLIGKKACLICHGDLSKRPKLAQAIKEIYPNDKATGYKMGDLRGAIVVEMPLKKKDHKKSH